ncbi:MAG: glycoside hydrolase family 32 protein [Chloroflexota bacterium]
MNQSNPNQIISDKMALNYHLMHPGGESTPGDPNPAFYIDGTYHLHYILKHTWKDKESFSFVHVTSQDMLHWTWQTTKLQPSFTGHGMFSGTGFLTLDGRPAAIYHGQASGRNHIAIAKDNDLTAWEKPYAVEPKTTDGNDVDMHHWDPDCFIINDTYYAISGGRDQPLVKSQDLVNWTYVGDFLSHELPDVAIGEDISCPNFFPLGDKWVLLCISHPFGCRYYIGDWDAENEQFVPETHERMNWRQPNQSIYKTVWRDFFAPESVMTPDGRRVMWAWTYTLHPDIEELSLQSLPRELSLGEDNRMRIHPLRELESLRYDLKTLTDITATPPLGSHSNITTGHLVDLDGDAFELKVSLDRAQVERKRFSMQLFSDEDHIGLPIMIRPETGTLLVGTSEAPFAIADLPEDEDLELRIFIDKYVVEVFANGRQAVIAAHMDYQSAKGVHLYTYGDPTTIRQIDIWKMKATNQGFFEARDSRIWEPETT